MSEEKKPTKRKPKLNVKKYTDELIIAAITAAGASFSSGGGSGRRIAERAWATLESLDLRDSDEQLDED